MTDFTLGDALLDEESSLIHEMLATATVDKLPDII